MVIAVMFFFPSETKSGLLSPKVASFNETEGSYFSIFRSISITMEVYEQAILTRKGITPSSFTSACIYIFSVSKILEILR